MHLNGDEFMDGSSLDENHEMLQEQQIHGGIVDARVVSDRVSEMERKLLEQSDELVCLKATLAEAIRRLSILEQQNHQYQVAANQGRFAGYTRSVSGGAYLNRPHSAINLTPAKPSGIPPVAVSGSGGVTSAVKRSGAANNNSSAILPPRRAIHYQSSSSLHSDSHSSSSASPAPSPSPRGTPQPRNKPAKPMGNNVTQPTAITTPANTTNSNSGSNGLHKRWSSTGDFHQNTQLAGYHMNSKFSAKSVLNLYSKANQNSFSSSSVSSIKHGTKDAVYSEEDKTVRFFLHGRSILLDIPLEFANNSYDIGKVTTAPSQRLKLDWVYGYRGRDCRSNLHFLPTGEMVYFVAAIVVLYNVEEHCQRHYLGHTDDVKSIAIHPSKMLLATGQRGGSYNLHEITYPHIRVWNSVSLQTHAVIGVGEFHSPICCLSFSKTDGGALLVAIEESADHTISLWEWQKGDNGHRITETKCSVDTVVAIEFHPLDRNTIVTVGKAHVAFWSLDAGGTTLYKRMGVFELRDRPKFITCIACLQTGETITGDSNGNLAIWTRGPTVTIWRLIKCVHDGPIFSICVQKHGQVVTGGGKDGRLVQFSDSLQATLQEGQIEGHYGGVRVVAEGWGTQLLVGTTKNCILSGSIELGFQPIMLGHYEDVWAIASNPQLQQFATAGHDRVLQLWDSMSHNILWSKDIGEHIQCLTFSNDGEMILVGCLLGRWMLFDTQTRALLGEFRDGNESIQVVDFSTNGQMIAIGAKDGTIYVYEIAQQYRKFNRIGKCLGHSGAITHIDWAENNQVLRSNSSDYELMHWNSSTCRQITQANTVQNLVWATNRCTITFTTLGIWPEQSHHLDGKSTDVNCCDCSHNKKLLVAGEQNGVLKLYSYPVIQTKSLCHSYNSHSGQITGVAFLHDDTRLVSIGGSDTAILQWIVS